jgi:Uma2 family endonuclease
VSFAHDHLQGFLYRLISDFVEDRDLGEVCGSEFKVRLPSAPSHRLADVFFVAKAREGQFSETTFEGAPDLVVEVVSPDSAGRDYREKFMEYEKAGVREYWIVDPMAKRFEAHELVKGKYRPLAEREGAVHSKVLKGLLIKPAWLWQKRLPKVSAVRREMGQK